MKSGAHLYRRKISAQLGFRIFRLTALYVISVLQTHMPTVCFSMKTSAINKVYTLF